MPDTQIHADQEVDARKLSCPMPVVKLAKAMKTLQPGQTLKLVATDLGATADVPAWCGSTGNTLLESHEEAGELVFYVRKEEA
ncbi:MAG: sulfurtransferase TusA family protein [Solirubrobacteraceae bacterium]